MDPKTQWVDWSKTTQSKGYRGSGSFATFLIIGPVCFFLGILFAAFPYDYPLLWTKAGPSPAYLDQLETHLRWMHQSPPLISRILIIMIVVCFLGFFTKLFRPSEANVLFDGASLALYVIGVGVYVTNIVSGLRDVSAGRREQRHSGPLTGDIVVGREDSLRVLSASNTILALVLVGVLILQAGQWYAERKEADDKVKPGGPRSPADRRKEKEGAAATTTASSRKKL